MSFGKTTPILRIFDEAKALAFYVDFLGFTVDWQHRFGDDFPLYLQVSRGDCVLHLSEHHGDCTPGSALRIETDELKRSSSNCWPSNTATPTPRSRPCPGVARTWRSVTRSGIGWCLPMRLMSRARYPCSFRAVLQVQGMACFNVSAHYLISDT